MEAKTDQGQRNSCTNTRSGLDVEESVLVNRGWRPAAIPEAEIPDRDTSQWISFHNHFWANTSFDVSVGTILDLSPWKDALLLLQLSNYRLLVRQEYADFYERLIDASKLSGSLRVITGSAGIGERSDPCTKGLFSETLSGKTVLLIYILIRRLVSSQATILVLHDTPILFRADRTYILDARLMQYNPLNIIHSDTPSQRPWVLIETPMTPTLPPSWLTHPVSSFPILATSLDERRYKPLVKEYANSAVWVMQVWNEQELAAIFPFLLGPDPSVEPGATTMAHIKDYGYSVRDLARAIRTPLTFLRDREKAFYAIEDVKDLLRIITDTQASYEDTFNHLFIVRRTGPISLYCDCYTVDVKSRIVLTSLMQADRRLSLLSARRIVIACHSSLESSLLAAWAFDRLVHHYLASGSDMYGQNGLLSCAAMTALEGSQSFVHSAWETIVEEFVVSSASVRVEAKRNQCFSRDSEKHELPLPKRHLHRYDELPSQLSEGEYYVPIKKSNPLFDAFFITRETKAVLWVVQTTMAARLGGFEAEEEGYASIETLRQRLGEDCSVKYVLVVPSRKHRAYRWEMPDGWEDYEGQVLVQYVSTDILGLFSDDNVDSIYV